MAIGVCCGVFLVLSALFLAVLTLLLNIFSQGQACESGSFLCSQYALYIDLHLENVSSHRSNDLSGDICIPQRFFCDGHPHCPNGEDESNVLCADLHGSNFIVDKIAKKMGAKESKLECGITGYPEGCQCKNATRLFCVGLGLDRIPDGVSPNVSRMSLANNSISHVPPGAFSRYNLDLIYLGGNGLTDVSSGAFLGQKKLEKLILHHNKLTVLEPGVFIGLRNMQWLMLNNNHLRTLSLHEWGEMQSLQWIDLSSNNITLEEESFPHIASHLELFLSKNSIVSIKKETFQSLSGLLLLDLCGNKIRFIHEDAFHGNLFLEELILTENYLSILPSGIFVGLHKLSKLWLGHNNDLILNPRIFDGLQSLSSLNLEDIEIENFDSKTFLNLTNLENIYFSSFYYCMQITSVPICKPNSDGVSSAEHLLVRPILRITLWLVAVFTCFGNMVVLFGRQFLLYSISNFPSAYSSNLFPSLPALTRISKTEESRNLIPSLFIRNLAASDLLMGFYLCVIGAKDIAFRGIFREKARSWMGSSTCSLIGIIAMTSSEVSILILICMSLERFVVIVSVFSNPLKLSLRAAQLMLGTIWALGFTLAIIPALHWGQGASMFYGTNGMCLPLHLHDDLYHPGWQYSAFIYLGINVVAMLLIALSYGGMLYSIIHTRQLASTSTTSAFRSPVDLHLALRFLLIVLTDALCWAPVAALKASALLGKHVSADVYGWVVVFILPFNSAFNPLIYTFTAPSFQLRPLMRFLLNSWRRIFRVEGKRSKKAGVKGSHIVAFGIQHDHEELSSRTGNLASTDCSGISTPSGKRSLEVNETILLHHFG